MNRPNLRPGDRILHVVMGAGTVLGCDELSIRIRFDVSGDRRLNARIALGGLTDGRDYLGVLPAAKHFPPTHTIDRIIREAYQMWSELHDREIIAEAARIIRWPELALHCRATMLGLPKLVRLASARARPPAAGVPAP